MSEVPIPEQLSPKQLLTQLGDTVSEQLDGLGSPPIPGDGEVVRKAADYTPRSRTSYVEFSDSTPNDGGPKTHTIGYVLHDYPNDLQVLEWQEGAAEIKRGVRFFQFPEDDVRFIETVTPNKATIDFLGSMVEVAEVTARQVIAESDQSLQPRRRIHGILGRLGLGRRKK